MLDLNGNLPLEVDRRAAIDNLEGPRLRQVKDRDGSVRRTRRGQVQR